MHVMLSCPLPHSCDCPSAGKGKKTFSDVMVQGKLETFDLLAEILFSL